MKNIMSTVLFLIMCGTTVFLLHPLAHFDSEAISQNGTWILQQVLSQNVKTWQEGISLSLSADGNTLVAGAPACEASSIGTGGVQVYMRSGTQWLYQATLVRGSDDCMGYSVSLSADGNTLAAGVATVNGNPYGGTEIFIRSGTSWKYQTTLSQQSENAGEGSAISLSADGNTLAVGEPDLNNYDGGVEIYVRSGANWQHQASLTQNVSYAKEGTSVALSADGNTLAVGAPNMNNYDGGVIIYTRSGTVWVYKATVSEYNLSSEGSVVALSADGTTIAAGAPGYNSGDGGVQIYAYTKFGDLWLHQASVSQGNSKSFEGSSLALSSDGSVLASGAPMFNSTQGITQLYVRSSNGWAHNAAISQVIENAEEGSAVALSANGTILAIGVPLFNSTGETFVYVNWTSL